MLAADEEVPVTVLQVRTVQPVPLVELLVGEADLAAAGVRLREQLQEVLHLRPRRLVVDLSGCASLDAAGLRVLLEAHRQLRRQDGALVLRGLSPRARRVIGLSGLGAVFDLEPA